MMRTSKRRASPDGGDEHTFVEITEIVNNRRPAGKPRHLNASAGRHSERQADVIFRE
jgi:hypothetical protein